MLTSAAGAHLPWRAEHTNLYRYVLRAARVSTAVADVRQQIADRLVALLGADFPGGVPPSVAEPLAAGTRALGGR